MSFINQSPETLISRNGALYVITGGMKRRKTSDLIHIFDGFVFSETPFQAFKPKCDVRKEIHDQFNIPYHHIASRTGQYLEAQFVDNEGDLSDLVSMIDLKNDVFGFDEFHLYTHGAKLKDILLDLRYTHKKTVVVAGLDRDFRGEVFPLMSDLMGHATEVDKNYGVCDAKRCKSQGEFSQRIVDGIPASYDSPIILVGASEAYEIRCLKHHEVPSKPQRETFDYGTS